MQWLGYSPADLVPFSRDTWLALSADYNQANLPVVAGGVCGGLLLLWLTARGICWRARAARALLGVCWLWIAAAFLHLELGRLLWAADWLAWGFAVQGLLLLLAAGISPPAERAAGGLRPGWWLLAFAVLALPALELAAGRDWQAIGWFGTAPDATAIGTLALLAVAPGRAAWLLLPIPLLWCLMSGVVLGVFDDPLWPLPPLAAMLGTLLLWRRHSSQGR